MNTSNNHFLNDNINIEIKKLSIIQRVYHILYPPELVIQLQLFDKSNIALPINYFLVGLLQGLSSGIITILLLQLNATESQQVTISSLRSLPSSFKILFGFISDAFPMFGYRRKTYMAFGWIMASVSVLFLSYITQSQNPSDNIDSIALFYFLFGFGFWFADVVSDSVIAEKTRYETSENQGRIQSTCYACRFFALCLSTTFITFCYEYFPPSVLFNFIGCLPLLTVIPAIYFFHEEDGGERPSVATICNDIWSILCSKVVWKPLGFIFLFNSLQIGNAAWSQYMYTVLKFTATEIDSFMLISYVLLYVSVMLYKLYLRSIDYRHIYIICNTISFILSIAQVLLILQINQKYGISNYLFSLGDDALGEFVYGLTYLPTIIISAKLCPTGSEGTAFALFTSVNNSAIHVAKAISTMLLSIWDVSKAALERGDTSGFLKLTVLTSVISSAAIVFVYLLPRGVDELASLDFSKKGKIGGFIILFTLLGAIAFSIVTSLLNILNPHWNGAS